MTTQLLEKNLQERYVRPACSVLAFVEDQTICQTSYTGSDIQPGEGVDWGTL